MEKLCKVLYISKYLLWNSTLSCRSVSRPNLPTRFSHAQ